MQLLALTNLPIYLPYDKAAIPFGDPIPGVTATVAAPGVFTAADIYTPTNGDVVALSFATGGSLPAPFTVTPSGSNVGVPGIPYALYYVVGASGQAFNLATTKGGTGVTTTTTGSLIILHLMSGETDGVPLPFKPNNTVLVENNSSGSLTLQGAPDVNVAAPGQGYNPPGGPGTFVTIAVLAAGQQVLVQLNFDWIRVSTSGTLYLQQN